MERSQLNAESRKEKGKGPARRVRAAGRVPAILYGQGKDTTLLTVDPKELGKTLGAGSNFNMLLDLKIDGQSPTIVMVKDYQADMLTRKFQHVDFFKVDLTKKILVEVPIHLTGKAPGVKEGGILEHTTRTIKVRCLPTAIPKHLEADVSGLNVGDNIHAHEMKFPEGVELPAGADFTIATVAMPVEEKVEATPGEVVQPEVLTEKKPAEGEAAAAGKDEKKGGKEEKK